MKQILQRLFGDERLTSDQTRAIMYEITRQSYPDAQIAAIEAQAEKLRAKAYLPCAA